MKLFLFALVLAFVGLVASVNVDGDISSPAPLLPNAELIEPVNITSAEGFVLFKQCDSRWGSERLGTCSLSVCQAGCAMSSVAMLLVTRGWSGTPGTLDTWLTNNGGYANGCDLYWGSVDKLGHTHCMGFETASYADVCTGVSQGHGVVINVRSGTHWVLVTGCAGNNVFLRQ